MKNDRISRILSDLEIGLRTDSSRLRQMRHDFDLTLQSARDLALQQSCSHEWHQRWNQRWDILAEHLKQISIQMAHLDRAVESGDRLRLNEALDAWDALLLDDARLLGSLSEIRVLVNEMDETSKSAWNLLDRVFDSNLKTIQAYSQALRVKLGLLADYPKEEVHKILQGILAKLPDRPAEVGFAKEEDRKDLDAAALEIGREQHQPGGLMDFLKALFMWLDAPEERSRK